MEKQSKPQYNVTFDDTNEYICSTDSADGIQSDEESLACKTGTNISKTSSAIGMGCEGGDMQSASSISTSILDDVEEVKVLKGKLTELEARNKTLDLEIEKVNLCLINERTKTTKLEKKLQFVKDNQDVFIKLKEAYINMKYNEAAGRKMVEIREKGLQTWEGILCRGCISAEQLRRQLESVQQTYKDSFIISPFQLEQLLSAVKYLKDLIDRRETMWSEIAERDEKIQFQLQRLEHENDALHDVLKCREHNKDSLKEEIPPGDDIVCPEITMYKKIIIKYEKRIREIEKSSHGLVKYNIPFNEREKKMIHYLMLKYFSRLNDKCQDKRSSRSLSRVQRDKSSRCSSTKDRSENRSNQASPIKDSPKPNEGSPLPNQHLSTIQCDTGEMGDTTLKLMNYFLDSQEEKDTAVLDNRFTV